ncbi:DUF3055 domain-containing protein [Brevibacillus sp. SYP-B805]|uniref:DUF3055 domain-containing protein n=1 Tax=Brevibacillus sp. SYP-B805 TaxID=1578199 RepID=UPI0013EB3CE7|nr:DUF3055 domain-containing protein [Brevibacillus sp. SYP-B805]NGQ96946.1 DUF3055 domain-containing protein [Brevibacillus sp. SYP-B805]
MTNELFYLYDETEETSTRFVSFMGKANRFDLAITTTNRFYGKKLVINIQNGRSAIIGEDDLDEEGYLEYAFQLSAEDAEDLRSFLHTVV